jgi:tRNA 2-thiocytidine biosynthesis protein TtcA
MKAMLADMEARMPGRKDVMIRALGHVRPSHLLDAKLFDFAALAPGAMPADTKPL